MQLSLDIFDNQPQWDWDQHSVMLASQAAVLLCAVVWATDEAVDSVAVVAPTVDSIVVIVVDSVVVAVVASTVVVVAPTVDSIVVIVVDSVVVAVVASTVVEDSVVDPAVDSVTVVASVVAAVDCTVVSPGTQALRKSASTKSERLDTDWFFRGTFERSGRKTMNWTKTKSEQIITNQQNYR